MKMNDEQFDELIEGTIKNFKGDLSDLCSAVGALVVGRYMGWRVIKIIFSPLTYRKYRKVLGVDYKDILSEEDQYSNKSVGLKLAKKLDDFWDIVHGRSGVKIDLKQKRLSE